LRLGQQDAGEVPVFHELRNRLRAVDNLAGLKVDKDILRHNAAVGSLRDGFERPAVGANVIRFNKHVFGVGSVARTAAFTRNLQMLKNGFSRSRIHCLQYTTWSKVKRSRRG
jgi:hypothetical protein